MNNYVITVEFTVKAENEKHAQTIVEYEVQQNIRFKSVPYAFNDSGIVRFEVPQK